MQLKSKTSVVAWLGASLAGALCLTLLGGCGQKGPLTLPPPPAAASAPK